MATVHQIQAALAAAVTGAVQGISVNTKVAPGWPPMKALQSIPQQYSLGTPLALVSIYDRRISRNVTRWLPQELSTTVVPSAMTSAISNSMIVALGSQTVTIGGSVNVGDAVSAVLTNYALEPPVTAAVVAIAEAGDTQITMGGKLATLVNADPTLSHWVSASAPGSVVTLTSLINTSIRLASYTGNGGSELTEIGRRERQLQIACWTPTEDIRQLVTDPIDTMLATAELNFGLTLPDGSLGRLCYENDYYLEDDTLEDVYRRDFLVRVDYPVTTTDLLFAVLAPILTLQTP